jgi:predicted nucleic acid-binding protein
VVFLDSNVWFYAFADSQGLEKHATAKELILQHPIAISHQIVSEVCNSLLRKVLSETEIQRIIRSFFGMYSPLVLTEEDHIKASSLRQQYRFSYWDSLIVAAALKSDSTILYSEDMQNGLVVDGRMTIRNPFIQ